VTGPDPTGPAGFKRGSARAARGQADAGACGPDVDPLVEKVRTFAETGYSRVALVQVGPDQEQLCDW
jgi:hypothetical protein